MDENYVRRVIIISWQGDQKFIEDFFKECVTVMMESGGKLDAQESSVELLETCGEKAPAEIQMDFCIDSGHGWLKTTHATLRRLKIASEITRFSYRTGETVYLEEDVDAPALINAFLERGIKINFTRHHQNNSPIRDLPPYNNDV